MFFLAFQFQAFVIFARALRDAHDEGKLDASNTKAVIHVRRAFALVALLVASAGTTAIFAVTAFLFRGLPYNEYIEPAMFVGIK